MQYTGRALYQRQQQQQQLFVSQHESELVRHHSTKRKVLGNYNSNNAHPSQVSTRLITAGDYATLGSRLFATSLWTGKLFVDQERLRPSTRVPVFFGWKSCLMRDTTWIKSYRRRLSNCSPARMNTTTTHAPDVSALVQPIAAIARSLFKNDTVSAAFDGSSAEAETSRVATRSHNLTGTDRPPTKQATRHGLAHDLIHEKRRSLSR